MAGSRGSPEQRRLLLANNRQRLAELYGEHRRYTVNYIARRVEPRHSHAVEDLAQDTFVKAWPSLHTVEVRDGSSYRRWLTAVARNRVLDYYRPDRPNAAGRHGAEAEMSPHAPLWWSPRLVYDSAAAAASDAVETRLDVRAALAQLPPETRRVLELRYLDGLSRDAVARAMGIGSHTILARTTEGLAALRERLDDGTHTGGPAAPAGERAVAVAREQIAGQGQWPTVREVVRRPGVSQGTASLALRSLRAQPSAETADPIVRAQQAVAQAHQRLTEQAAATRAQQEARWHAADQAAQHAADPGTAVFAADGAT